MKTHIKVYQIYIYDRQLKKYSNLNYGIDGYYYDPAEAEKALARASGLEHNQLVLSELTNSICCIVAIAHRGIVQYVSC